MNSRRFAGLHGSRHRDMNRHNRAGAITAVSGLNMTALGLNKAAADRQAKTRTSATPILRMHAIEFVENALQIARRDARSLIDDFDRHRLAIAPGSNIDTAAGRRVFGGIVQKVEQHLLEQ